MKKELSVTDIKEFQDRVNEYFKAHGRDLPWRGTDDPYAILVSEMMLQQTQVPRVIEKYKAWIRRFPTAFELAEANFQEVLTYWSGLGYNRRARYLKQSADIVIQKHRGIFPASVTTLMRFPGVGMYTASAIMVFAHNQPLPLIETNVRAVLIHHFFDTFDKVGDKDLLPLVEQTMDRKNPGKWFNALMDYGTHLKEQFPELTLKSKQYTKQSPLKGSVREVRGWIIKQLTTKSSVNLTTIEKQFAGDETRIQKAVEGLVNDHFIVVDATQVKMTDDPPSPKATEGRS